MMWWLYGTVLTACIFAVIFLRFRFTAVSFRRMPLDLSPEELMPHSSHETKARGLQCPECQKKHIKVYYYDMVGRLAQCQDCGYYFVQGRAK